MTAATGAARYSRFVVVMKLLLPLLAIALLAIAIAWPEFSSEDEQFGLTFDDITTVDNDLRMTNPRYTGTDSKDRPFMITAQAAVQDPDHPSRVTLDLIEADLDLPEDGWLGLEAKKGTYDTDQKTLVLQDGVSVYSDRGYEFHATAAQVDLEGGVLHGDGPVHVQGPSGILTADSLEVFDRGERMIFSGGVRVRLLPGHDAAG